MEIEMLAEREYIGYGVPKAGEFWDVPDEVAEQWCVQGFARKVHKNKVRKHPQQEE